MPQAMVKINGIPAIGFGTYPLSGAEARAAVEMALGVGFRHIDTAQMYGNEAEVGRAVAASGLSRGEVFVTTKVSAANLGSARFVSAVRKSLEDLKIEQVDLLLIHWPPADEKEIPATIDELNKAADLGLAAQIGISNFPVKFMRLADSHSARKLIDNQVEFHPFLNQAKLRAAAVELGITLSAYCPLARGAALMHPVINAIAERLGEPASAVVLRWIIQQGVIPVPMTSKRANAEANLRALSITLSDEDMAAISKLTAAGKRYVSPGNMSALWDR
jgi:2,5-diketo-D-gluconate reductase B